MCTVSFVPLERGLILTSNRDEHVNRGFALCPQFYQVNSRQLVFPKDGKAGGTWFVSNKKGDVGVLLNGAFEKHTPMPPYRKSRGLVLLDLFDAESPYEKLRYYDFSEIENFTLVLWEHSVLREITWDGNMIREKKHNPELPHIWSSVTLYSENMITERHGWFKTWISSKKKITKEDIFDFHYNTQNNNKEYGLRINRNNQMSTSSITSLCLNETQATIRHHDLIQNIKCVIEYECK